MAKPGVANLDRRVEVLEGSADQKVQIRKVSDLRDLPFVVLLGEPGIGKSTALEIEAAHEGSQVLKVRALMTGARSASATLFLDALDEYRADGNPLDKAYGLAQAISGAQAVRWRLTCRSEDWRKEGDIVPIQATTAGTPIVVAQILPLNLTEASAVLRSLGEIHPEAFLDKAQALGAIAFTENPLSLKLLCNAVADGGSWPSTRFALFKSAIARLGYEKNRERNRTNRSSQPEILRAAGIASLYLLLSGARSIWRSNDEPPTTQGDGNAFLTAHDLNLSSSLTKDLLDTALFRGEGEAFEPMHRTVAEYLAAQALAHAVIGCEGQAAFPLSRALALITGSDGRPPTELRGVFAWFAAHLAALGEEAGASRLIEIDAATVLTYGDAGAFSTYARRAILANIGRDDPFFRSSEIGITAVGGLAGEDLSSELSAVLLAPPDGTHRVMTVLEVLTVGPPVISMRPLLRELALDPRRPQWVRWRSADVWVNGSESKQGARRELYEAVGDEEKSPARLAFRLHLAASAIEPQLSLGEIKDLLADYQGVSKGNSIGSLFSLQHKLQEDPIYDLFEQPVREWLPSNHDAGYKTEVDSFLDHALAASIRSDKSLSADRLLKWIINLRKHDWSDVGSDTSTAIDEWLNASSTRDFDLFQAHLVQDNPENGPWVVLNAYMHTTKKIPPPSLIRQLLESAKGGAGERAKRLLDVVVEAARLGYADPNTYWEIVEHVGSTPRHKGLLSRLTVWKLEPWRFERYKSRLAYRLREDKQRTKNIAELGPLVDEIRAGKRLGVLDWGSHAYFESKSSGGEDIAGLEGISTISNEEIATAVCYGWEALIKSDFAAVDAEMLGKAAGENRRYFAEFAVLAGLDRRFEINRTDDLHECAIEIALCVLKSGWLVRDANRRNRLTQWAVSRLGLSPVTGVAAVLRMWNASLDTGGKELLGLSALAEHPAGSKVLVRALEQLIAARPALPPTALGSALVVLTKQLPLDRLQHLTHSALQSATVAGESRRVWGYAVAVLDGTVEPGCSAKVVLRTFHDVGEQLLTAFDMTEEMRIRRARLTVRHLGPLAPPSGRFEGGWVNARMRRESVVNSAVNSLAASEDPSVGSVFLELLEDQALTQWRFPLLHARAQQLRLSRDKSFVHPSHQAIRAAISGKEPVNAADLRAVTMEELVRLKNELHSSSNTPWKRYWNTDSYGAVTSPQIENQCRDHLLERLQDRLQPYRIAAALPEARLGEETRADMLILSGAGWSLPVEAKRHFHPEIWSAASAQLQGYITDSGSGGFGIYLVFWFGNDAEPTPARPDGQPGPESAPELEAMLETDLPSQMKSTTDVIVFDVSDPAVAAIRKPRRKRSVSRAN